jgi:ATP-dependent Clp protease protease subunit
VSTYCIGQASSGAAVVLMAGAKGKRFILPNAKVMLHQPYGGITGQAEDIRIQAEEVIRDKRRLNEIMAECTGQTYEAVSEATERDRYMNAEEARVFGIVDEVLREETKDKAQKKSK